LLPPNLTWLLQPADLTVFGSFKTYLRQEVDAFVLQGHEILKTNIVSLLSRAFLAALSPANVQAGFTKAGIWPFNPSAIPSSMLSLEGSVAKAAVAAEQAEAKKLADCKARLLAVPDNLRELFSLPRLLPAAKRRASKRKLTARALLVTTEGMLSRLKAVQDKKSADEAAKEERKAARAERAAAKAQGKRKSAPKAAAAKPADSAAAGGAPAAAAVAAVEAPAPGDGPAAAARDLGRKRKFVAASSEESEPAEDSEPTSESSGDEDAEDSKSKLASVSAGEHRVLWASR
jgi:hypothetical protein